jgi:hypothetical protein
MMELFRLPGADGEKTIIIIAEYAKLGWIAADGVQHTHHSGRIVEMCRIWGLIGGVTPSPDGVCITTPAFWEFPGYRSMACLLLEAAVVLDF